MIKFVFFCMMCLGAFVPAQAQNESQAPAEPLIEDSANFIRAYLMVGEASHLYPQCAFGHAFLRLQSPPNNLDYCFSMESGKFEGFFDICLGNYPNRLVPVPTAVYLKNFDNEGRTVTAYPLDITLEEGQRLWKLLDNTALAGISPYHDFFHHGCSHEIIALLEKGVGGQIVFGKGAREYDGTLFTLGDRLLAFNSPMRLPPFMLMTTDGSDRQLSDMDKTTFPTILPTILGDATIVKPDGTRHGLFKQGAEPVVFRPKQTIVNTAWPFYLWFGLLLLLTVVACGLVLLLPRQWSVRLADVWGVVLFVLYNVLTFILLFFCLFSSLPTIHGWNWNFLVYNLIPLGVWLVSLFRPFSDRLWRRIHLGYALWLCAFMVVMWAWGGHQIMEQYLLVGTFAAYCFFRWMRPSPVSCSQPES